MTLAQLTACYGTLGVLLHRASVPRNRCDSLSCAAGSEQIELFEAEERLNNFTTLHMRKYARLMGIAGSNPVRDMDVCLL
jgi:hypothetical protein